jgi:putative mRNA 3-end processing factor
MALPPGSLLELTPQGLYCRAAEAWIDPWRPVSRALITHAHADHARPGCGEYWAIGSSEMILRKRLGAAIKLNAVSYEEQLHIDAAQVSFHPAGHVLGSAQIRVEAGGESWLVSGVSDAVLIYAQAGSGRRANLFTDYTFRP